MAKKTPKQIRFNLSGIMEQRGLKVDEVVTLCDAAGTPITRTTVYKLREPDVTGVYLSSLTALCNGLDVSPCELFVEAD